MTESEAKKENPFKDHVLDKLLGKKDSDRLDSHLIHGFENQNSSFQQSSVQKTKKYSEEENNSRTGADDSKNPSGPSENNFDDPSNRKIDELSRIPEKAKRNNDFRNFKSMTIDRMGKILKFKSANFNEAESELSKKKNERDENETRTVFNPYDQPTRKEKTNSLGRMLKLMDKDINPRRIFGHSASKSAKHPEKPKTATGEKSKSDDPIRRAFSKILSQIKGRSKNECTPAEPNIRTLEEKSKDSHPSRTLLAPRIISSLSSSQSRLSPIKKPTPLTHNPTSSTSGIP